MISFFTRYKLVSLLALGFILLGGIYYVFFQKSPVPQSPPKRVLVEVARVQKGTVHKNMTVNGVLAPSKMVTLVPEVEGHIRKLHFKQGTFVKKGQTLIQFEDDLARAQVQEAQAKLALATADFQRVSRLVAQDFSAPAALEKIRTEMEVQKAALSVAKIRLGQTTIKAPFEGVVGLQNISEGSFVQRNQELLQLVSYTPIFIDFRVPESIVRQFAVGDKVDVEILSDEILPEEAVIIAFDAQLNRMNHTIQVRAELPNTEGLYKPGQFTRVSVPLNRAQEALLVPVSAVEKDNEQMYAYVVIDQVAVKAFVTTGAQEKGMVEILHGLKEGEQVVVSGQMRLHDGVMVKIVSEAGK